MTSKCFPFTFSKNNDKLLIGKRFTKKDFSITKEQLDFTSNTFKVVSDFKIYKNFMKNPNYRISFFIKLLNSFVLWLEITSWF